MIHVEKDRLAFLPHPIVRFGQVQTYLAKIRPRNRRRLEACEYPIVLDGGADYSGKEDGGPVRLLGYYSPRWKTAPSKGVVLLLHGWQGCSHSLYNIVLGESLCEQGYDLFRLNMRDHGPSFDLVPPALNRGLFLATLIEEVETAVRQVAAATAPLPIYVVGVSMGGNFALRLAARHTASTMPNLRHVIAISPSINPGRSVDAIDTHPELLRFFRRHWIASLRQKESLFPELYQFQALYRLPSLRGMTEWLVRKYTHYPDADAYFAKYAVLGDALANLTVPVTVLSAGDDPVVPSVDFYALARSPNLDLQLFPYGGHVGFVDILPFQHHLPRMVGSLLDKSQRGQG